MIINLKERSSLPQSIFYILQCSRYLCNLWQENIHHKTIRINNKRLIVSNYDTGALEKQILASYKL